MMRNMYVRQFCLMFAGLALMACDNASSPAGENIEPVSSYKITLEATPSAAGHITISPEKSEYPQGSEVTLTAIPSSEDYHFASWGNSVTGSENPITIRVQNNMDITAQFSETVKPPEPVDYKVSLDVAPKEGGKVTISPDKSEYAAGSLVTLTAEAAEDGYEFIGWVGDITSDKNPLQINVDKNLALTANFRKKEDEDWVARVIKTPENIDARFTVAIPPKVIGTTSHQNEKQETEITDFNRYQVNDDFVITMGRLNHSKNEKILSMEFKTGTGLALHPLERSTGQWSMESTTKSMGSALAKGVNIIGAINADPYNMFNGWNVGITTINGVNYSGANTSHTSRDFTESAVIVKNDDTVEIWGKERLPLFTMNWYHNGQAMGGARAVYHFDKEKNENKFKFFADQSDKSISVYSGDNYRSIVNINNKRAVLVRPEANEVTVIANKEGSNRVQYPPFSSKVVKIVSQSSLVIPSGHALIVTDGNALANVNPGDSLDIRYETDDPAWLEVKHALGGGFMNGLLVENGSLSRGAEDQSAISSRTALGVRADGSAFFLTVDKPTLSPSDGVTLKKLGQIMLAYGAKTAIELDGGGSTTMAYRMPGSQKASLLNTPSDGSERPVATKWALMLTGSGNYANQLQLFPKSLTVLAGAEYRDLLAIGYDGKFDSLSGDLVLGTSDAKLGRVHKSDLAFTAGQEAFSGYLLLQSGEQTSGSKLNVVTEVDSLNFALDSLVLEAGESRSLQPTLRKNGEPVFYNPSQLTYHLDTLENGTIDPETGIFTAKKVQGGETRVTMSYGGQSASILIKVGVPPTLIEDFEKGIQHYTAKGARAISLALDESTDIFYSGKKSAKLQWKADPAQPGTFGAYLTDPVKLTKIEGYPKRLGVNIYIPEELAEKNWWMRGLIRDNKGKSVTIDYNQSSDPLPAAGWHYVDAKIPEGFEPPFFFDQPFRFLVTSTAERIDSSIYLDDFIAVYSDSTDLHGPDIEITPAKGETVSTHSPAIKLKAADTSGINPETVLLKLDGKEVSAAAQFDGIDTFTYQTSGLKDGWHKVDYSLGDRYGNITTGDYLFNIVTGAPRIYVDDSQVDSFSPGTTFRLPIRVIGGDAFTQLNLTLGFDSTKYALKVVDNHLKGANINLTSNSWSAEFSGFSQETQTLATIEITLHDYISRGDAALTISGTLDGKPFYYPVIKKEISSLYRLFNRWIEKDGINELIVVDKNGQVVSGVKIEKVTYNAATDTVSGIELLGVTDINGRLSYPLDCHSEPGDCSTTHTFRIFDSKGSSLIHGISALPENLTSQPRYIYLTPGKRTDNVNLTWYTNTANTDSTVMFGEGSLVNKTQGSSEVIPFLYGPEAGLVRVHHASLSGLAAGTQYLYQIGEGTDRSEIYQFTTASNSDEVRIHLLGDTQTLDNNNINNGAPLIGELLAKMDNQLPQKDLILHVGDFTDDLSLYQLVRKFFEQVEGQDKASSVPLVIAQGNHEVINDGATKYASMFSYPYARGLPFPVSKAVYSFDYNNVHIAVITAEVSTDKGWQDMMEWLRNDMKNSNKQWKILISHRPPYEANPASGNGLVKKYLPSVVDEVGIDLVLSGHDHIYSRSVPLKQGQPDPAGATYLIAGSDSAKFYDAGLAGIVPVADVLFDTNIQVFTTLHIKGDAMEVETRTLYGELVDSYTLYAKPDQ
ncbi:phosphodiester glycosidase family protein [Serratia sp. DD3]|uniref:phosphodiester glycosidase family protein n=1 Tax=Serratia sp. DD3 TaxID=1410619 RepID=UPI0004D9EE4C|nr:phosphodiester glycosidase family protein [Serratia sp. DD3]KEY59684.1 exopolysaccharide biosynthesis protein related to N-acetylglucosamine-1-phosphodiester alpha-N-acetylglucosaminidase [Serratia sp. DD3]